MITRAYRASVAAIVGLAAAGFAGPSFAEVQTIKLVEHATSDTITDTGDEDDSVGDILTFANALYDADNKNQMGTDNGWCVRTVAGQSWECFWTATLKDGQITVEGPFLDAADSVLAITGGTGAYAGAKGEMMLHSRNPEGSEYDFVYGLVH